MRPAPLYHDIALLPDGGEAFFVTTEDAKSLRIARWAGVTDASGTVLICVGRGEYLEKYDEVITYFRDAGYGVVIFEWRGQGLSERLPHMVYGHVKRFDEYQKDVRAVVSELSNMPGPLFVLAHSMGGLIASRAVAEGPLQGRVACLALSAPMYALSLPKVVRLFAPFVLRFLASIGLSKRPSIGVDERASFEKVPFASNNLTRSAERYAHWKESLTRHPDLRIGGPTIAWMVAALDETTAQLDAAVPDIPVLTLLGSKERVVSASAVLGQLERMPSATLVRVEDGLHETLMDGPEQTGPLLARLNQFFISA